MLRAVAAERQRTMQIGGRRFAWRSLGTGPPLLLINGYAASSADWDPAFVAKLAASFELICPDNRGIGDSELGQPSELSVDAMAGDLESLLDELGLARAAVAGWSMGGYVAQRLALRAPERVAAMALLATAPGGPTALPAEAQAWARLIDHSGTPREQAARLISLLFPPGIAPEIDREFGEAVAAARAQLSERALFAQEHALTAWHAAAPQLPGRDSPPVLVLCGSEDVVIPPQNSDLLAAFWPGVRSECFAGAGHAFIAEQPERVGELIVAFLDEQQIAIRWARDAEDVRGAFALREAVFFGEQNVPLEEEIDELDRDAQQLVVVDSSGTQVIGTLRLLSFGGEAKIGRVAVAKQWRRRGIASRMLDVALERAREQGFERVRLAAQVVAVALYEQAGFAVESEPFEEAGITHVWMGLALGR